MSLKRKWVAEWVGTALLLATVVGSGIMAHRLSGGSVALALLANTLATAAMLVALIFSLAPVSGAHFNPAVSWVEYRLGRLSAAEAAGYMVAQITGAVSGVFCAHLMFEEPLKLSRTVRFGPGQWVSEAVATFGLISVILLCAKKARRAVPLVVGAYIAAAYWFTASTSFANPAVTLARALSDTFAGIRPLDTLAFVAAQLLGAAVALGLFRFLYPAPVAVSFKASP